MPSNYNERISSFCLRCCLLTFLLCFLAACTSDWWSRGQTPSPATLFKRASSEFKNNQVQFAKRRPQLAAEAKDMEALLGTWILESTQASEARVGQASHSLVALRDQMMAIAPLLSIGSRPAWEELSEQFRTMSNTGSAKHQSTLLAARILFLLSNELSVPAPTMN